jgi:dienelactone hydrolase
MHLRNATSVVLLFGLFGTLLPAMGNASEAYSFQAFNAPSPYSVSAIDLTWSDTVRGRQIPVRIYRPVGDSASERFPLIVFSTGLGRSRDDCAYLGRHWASCGYVAVHVQHVGSDEETREGTLRPRKELQRAFYSPQNVRNRPLDIIFVIDQMDRMQRHGKSPIARCDMSRIGVAGHDFGAQTALGLAGQVLPGQIAVEEPRIKAVVAMSSPVPSGQVSLDRVYRDISRPCLHITGTEDNSIVGTTQASQRRIPFDHIAGVDQYLLTFLGSDHMTYSGHLRTANGAHDGVYQRFFAECTAVFWDAYLKDNAGAKAWLTGRPMQDHLRSIARVEKKVVADRVTNEAAKEQVAR